MKIPFLLALLAWTWTGILLGQDRDPASPPTPEAIPLAPAPPSNPVITTLRGLAASMAAIGLQQVEARKELEELRRSGGDVSEIKAAGEKLSALGTEMDGLRQKFEELATGTNDAAFEADANAEVELSHELKVLLEPMIYELRKSTERPREIERLRTEQEAYLRRQEMARGSLARLDELLPQLEASPLKSDLEKLRDSWLTKQARVKSELETANLQLAEAREKQDSLFTVIGEFTSKFVARRGKSFALAIVAGLGTFFLFAFLIRLGDRLVPDKEEIRRSLPFRMTRLVLFVSAGLLSLLAFLGVLYTQSDWLLLGLSLIFILGFLWAAKRALLPFYEQLKTILNLGPVREGERVIFDGIPWEVKSINFYTDLVNPMLSGGHVRVALADLTDLHSRPKARKEPLFPCKVGEWVGLSDGTYGTVLSQTPELVRLRTIPGSVVSYQTASFLGLAPDNHSDTFGLRVPVGIDYQHQDVSTTEVREKLEAFIKAGLEEVIDPKNIKGLWVEFSSAGASSLDYLVGITLDGAVAGRKPALTRAVQRLFVDACNKYNWVIPFTQVTIHQAA